MYIAFQFEHPGSELFILSVLDSQLRVVVGTFLKKNTHPLLQTNEHVFFCLGSFLVGLLEVEVLASPELHLHDVGAEGLLKALEIVVVHGLLGV